jgi:hypothetical protein
MEFWACCKMMGTVNPTDNPLKQYLKQRLQHCIVTDSKGNEKQMNAFKLMVVPRNKGQCVNSLYIK